MAEPLTLAQLNELPHEQAVAAFLQCCASREWAEHMAAGRPYADVDSLMAAADSYWEQLGPDAWREAFAGHPRIGERHAAAPTTARAARWSAQEQTGMSTADAASRQEMTRLQHEYERRFGHIFLICATGLGADEMLTSLRQRLHNDPDDELRVAAGEQRRITRLRLEKLLSP